MTHDFVVSLSRAAPETVTVDYGTDVGTAVAGADYTEANGTFTLAAGETEKTVAVTALDDAHHEGEETMMLVLSNAGGARIRHGEVTGMIENSDAIPKVWLACFWCNVADHVVDAVVTRRAGLAGSFSHVTLGGQRIALDGGAETAPGSAVSDEADRRAAESLAALAGLYRLSPLSPVPGDCDRYIESRNLWMICPMTSSGLPAEPAASSILSMSSSDSSTISFPYSVHCSAIL